jgi:hypothetical protein
MYFTDPQRHCPSALKSLESLGVLRASAISIIKYESVIGLEILGHGALVYFRIRRQSKEGELITKVRHGHTTLNVKRLLPNQYATMFFLLFFSNICKQAVWL